MSMSPIVLMLVKRCVNNQGPDCSIDLTSFDYLLTNDGQWVDMESYLSWKGAIDQAEAVVLKGGPETCPSLEGGIYFPWLCQQGFLAVVGHHYGPLHGITEAGRAELTKHDEV